MVNLEEILEKKPYTCPIMVVERIDFSDILTTSGGVPEGQTGTTTPIDEGIGGGSGDGLDD